MGEEQPEVEEHQEVEEVEKGSGGGRVGGVSEGLEEGGVSEVGVG